MHQRRAFGEGGHDNGASASRAESVKKVAVSITSRWGGATVSASASPAK